jgi:hypothetical protein
MKEGFVRPKNIDGWEIVGMAHGWVCWENVLLIVGPSHWEIVTWLGSCWPTVRPTVVGHTFWQTIKYI